MSKEETMVERCAGAIAKSDGYIGLDAVPRETRNMFMRRAGAVIDALMEPTPEMVAAAAPSLHPSQADYAVALEAVKLLPRNDHPDIGDVLAQLSADYRAMLSKAKEGTGE